MQKCKQVLTFVIMKAYSNTAIKILEATKLLFEENAYHAVSTKKIAQKAQVNEVTIFRLFQSKEKLFEAMLAHFFLRPSFDRIATLRELNTLKEYLHALAYILHEFFTSNISLIKIELREGNRIYNKRNLSNFSKVATMLSKQFQRFKQIPKEQADIEAFCFMTGLHGMFLNLYVFRSINDEMTFDDCLAFFISKYE